MTCASKEKIISIEEITDYDDYVYDLEVDDVHTFMANDIFVHNTDSVFLNNVSSKLTAEDMDKEYYKFFNKLFNNFNLEGFNSFEYENKLTGAFEKHIHFAILEWEKTFESIIIVAKKRYYFMTEDGKVNTQGGAFKKSSTNPLGAELQKGLVSDILRNEFKEDYWYEKIKSWKTKAYNQSIDTKYLTSKVNYSKHWSTYGGVMIDKSTGEPKLRKDGTIRYKNIPSYIRLARRLEEEGKEVPIGDMILYILGKPLLINYKPKSRKKVDRELFMEIHEKYFNEGLEILKEKLEEANLEMVEMFEPNQRAISIDEYKNGEKYDVESYWNNITSPQVEILHTVNKELCYGKFGDLWNMTERQILKELNK